MTVCTHLEDAKVGRGFVRVDSIKSVEVHRALWAKRPMKGDREFRSGCMGGKEGGSRTFGEERRKFV